MVGKAHSAVAADVFSVILECQFYVIRITDNWHTAVVADVLECQNNRLSDVC
jgi:hypothetical protein